MLNVEKTRQANLFLTGNNSESKVKNLLVDLILKKLSEIGEDSYCDSLGIIDLKEAIGFDGYIEYKCSGVNRSLKLVVKYTPKELTNIGSHINEVVKGEHSENNMTDYVVVKLNNSIDICNEVIRVYKSFQEDMGKLV